ncbi:HET-domain-containing protein [Lojkania enalia]|uniref:HET-domain-containing protein n=1 Tax=Lojkania enalia TaxID=147567 RepID=A0A9P4NAG8_9PLEO|nr:HET-domain-containing protein [Didymosphaeria enalia]
MEVIDGACSACRELFASYQTRSEMFTEMGTTYSRKIFEISEGSLAGCIICKHLKERHEEYVDWEIANGNDGFRVGETERTYRFYAIPGQPERVIIYVDVDKFEYKLKFLPTTDKDDQAFEFFPNERSHLDVGSSRAFSWATNKLQECFEQHPVCRDWKSAYEGAFLPKRLIDVNGYGENLPRLYLSTPGERGSYAALSYCWGGPQKHATTEALLVEYVKAIPPSRMPKTILDAITATQRLGLRFLWIDSYCILQDSETDKATEIGKMGSIYSKATITLVAASTKNCHDGFLNSRLEDMTYSRETRCTIRLRDEAFEDAGSLTLEVDSESQDISPQTDPLNQRAWTLQETILSPRKLYYGRERLYWICRIRLHSDGGGIRSLDRYLQTHKLFRGYDYPEHGGGFKRFWRNTIRDYTKRNLSVPSDKLPAISAIARLANPNFGWDYAAGLWRNDLVEDLTWERVPSSSAVAPSEWRAPSWSWASLDTAVEYVDKYWNFRASAEILGCRSEPLHRENLFGHLKSAELEINGPLRPAYFDGHSVLSDVHQPVGTWVLDREKPLYQLDPSISERLNASVDSCQLGWLLQHASKMHEKSSSIGGETAIAWCLTLGVGVGVFASSEGDLDQVRGLILMKASDGSYQRVGAFRSPGKHLEWFMQAPRTTVAII